VLAVHAVVKSGRFLSRDASRPIILEARKNRRIDCLPLPGSQPAATAAVQPVGEYRENITPFFENVVQQFATSSEFQCKIAILLWFLLEIVSENVTAGSGGEVLVQQMHYRQEA
jgi:hypothetical protein